MSIITLTTDLGLKDFYLSTVKAAILKGCKDADIIDVTHEIPAFDLAEAAFQLRNAYPHFPQGTIHVVSVDTLVSSKTRYLVMEAQEQYFIGADNGLFSLVFDELPEKVYQIEQNENGTVFKFPLKDILVKAAVHLANGNEISGKPVSDIQQMTNLHPVIMENSIKGSVIHVDHYDNVILNITREIFEGAQKDREIVIHVGRSDYLDKIESNYYDVEEGEKICFFNASGFLEIAINKGRASSLLGLKLGDLIQIDFE